MVYLFIYMVVAAHGSGLQTTDVYRATQPYYGWVNQGEFTADACPKAAAALSIQGDKFRCVPKGKY